MGRKSLCATKEIPCKWQRLVRKTQRHLLVWKLTSLLQYSYGFLSCYTHALWTNCQIPLLATVAAHWENINQTMEPLVCSKELEWRSFVSTQYKSPVPLVLSHSSDRGEKEGPALAPARHSLAQLCLLSWAMSDLCWPQGSYHIMIMLHTCECTQVLRVNTYSQLLLGVSSISLSLSEKYPVVTCSISGKATLQDQQSFSYYLYEL